jgi:FtsZ-binding cell division protein ZapB
MPEHVGTDFAVDGELLEAAHRLVIETETALQSEFQEITELNSTNQVAKFAALRYRRSRQEHHKKVRRSRAGWAQA